ncbi:MAG: M91 family zinc metallopeptidase [Planctomycetota bacterium]
MAFVALVLSAALSSGKALAQGALPVGTETYSSAIEIKGPEDQRALIRAQLDSLAKLPTGKKLLEAIAASANGKTITIEYKPGAASVLPGDKPAAYVQKYEMDGDKVKILEPGTGSSSTLFLDPSWIQTNAGLQIDGGIECMTPEIILGHELTHALHNLQGKNLRQIPFTEDGGKVTNYEERVTSGLSFTTEPDGISENAIRQDQNVTARPQYSVLCDPGDGADATTLSKGFLSALTHAPAGSDHDRGRPRPKNGAVRPQAAKAISPEVAQAQRPTKAERQKAMKDFLNGPVGE